MITHATIPRPPGVTVAMIRKANARSERLGIAPRYALMRTLLPNGRWRYVWVTVPRMEVAGTF